MTWTHDQLKIIIESALEADGGCAVCIQSVLSKFLDLTSWELLDRLDVAAKDVDFRNCHGSDWIDCRPDKEKHEEYKDIKWPIES